jgi:hypothetical protein
MKRYIIISLSLVLSGAVFTIVPADIEIEDTTYGQRLKDTGQYAYDAAAARASALKDATMQGVNTGIEYGKYAGAQIGTGAQAAYGAARRGAGTAYNAALDTGVPLATTTEYALTPYDRERLMQEVYGGYIEPRKQIGRRRNVTFGEAGQAIGRGAQAGYYGTMAGLDAGVDTATRGAQALGRGVQRGYYGAMAGLDAGVDAAGRGARAGWRRFVNTGVPGTSETEYQVISEETPYSFGEWMGTSPVQRRKTVGEAGQAIGRGAQAAYGAARRAPGAAWRGFVDTGIPLTSVTETELLPYELDVFGDLTPRQKREIQRRRTFGEVGQAIGGGAQAGYNRAATGTRALYGAAGRGTRAGWNQFTGGVNYLGSGVANIPALGTSTTEYAMQPYDRERLMQEAFGGYIAPREQIATQRRKTLGEKAGEMYNAVKSKFSSKK